MSKSTIKTEILAYLLRHPAAQDTLEGIVQWWLLEERIRLALPEVRAALNELVEQKLVTASQRKDGRTHYRLNPEKQSEISTMLEVPPKPT